MKILLLNLLMNLATNAEVMNGTEDYSWVLQSMEDQNVEVSMAGTIENKVKIFDQAGNLVKEILRADFENNQMERSDYKLLAKSAFMFDYLGDSYFLLDK